MGVSEKRKLFELGGSYGRRLQMNHVVNWQFSAEFLPVALESDPLSVFVQHQTSPTNKTFVNPNPGPLINCTPQTIAYSYTVNGTKFAGTTSFYCKGREWTIGEAMSPVGFEWNFRPRHPLQPFLIAHGGTMYSTHPIPIEQAGSFNFTFDAGAGIELYQSRTRSLRADYRFHHISNHGTADANPGIDNGVLQVTYAIGR